MAYLIDTNVLLTYIFPGRAEHSALRKTIRALSISGENLFITPQNLIEFWNVATRPANRNGLGLTTQQAEIKTSELESVFPLAPDAPEIYPQWRR